MMTQFFSKVSAKQNTGFSTIDQNAADAQAAQMDAQGCIDCTNCANCIKCKGCVNCADLKNKRNCEGAGWNNNLDNFNHVSNKV